MKIKKNYGKGERYSYIDRQDKTKKDKNKIGKVKKFASDQL